MSNIESIISIQKHSIEDVTFAGSIFASDWNNMQIVGFEPTQKR